MRSTLHCRHLKSVAAILNPLCGASARRLHLALVAGNAWTIRLQRRHWVWSEGTTWFKLYFIQSHQSRDLLEDLKQVSILSSSLSLSSLSFDPNEWSEMLYFLCLWTSIRDTTVIDKKTDRGTSALSRTDVSWWARATLTSFQIKKSA